jgi:hypothetical protein
MGNDQSAENKKSILLLEEKIDKKIIVINNENKYVLTKDFDAFKQTVNSNFTVIGKTIPLIPSEI